MSSFGRRTVIRRASRILAIATALLIAASGCKMAFSPLEVGWYDEEAFLEETSDDPGSQEDELEDELEDAESEEDEDDEEEGETKEEDEEPVVPEEPVTVSVTLAWDANAEPTVAGYKLYYGTESGVYDTVVDAGEATEQTLNDIVAGTTYYFAVTAYDDQENESEHSEEVSYTS